MIKALYLPVLLLLLAACKQEPAAKTTEATAYCPNALQLISAPDSLPVVDMDYNMPQDKLLLWLEERLGSDLCEPTYFGVPLKPAIGQSNIINLKVVVNKYCGSDPIYLREVNNFTVRVNSSDKLLIDNEPGTIDSISNHMHRYYFEGLYAVKDPRHALFMFHWQNQASKKFVQQTLIAIADGYLAAANAYAQKQYKTELCSLTTTQLATLQDEFPFYLELNINDTSYPPLPIPSDSILIISDTTETLFPELEE